MFLEYRKDFGWIGWIDNRCVFGFVVDDQIGVVVAATFPCMKL